MFGDPISNSKNGLKTLGEVVEFNTGKLDSNAAEENGIYPFSLALEPHLLLILMPLI